MFWASRAALPFAAFAFLAGLGWLFLFPIATISQGKMGCRSTHVEENALPKLYRPPGSSAEALLNPALQALQHIEDSNGYDMDTLSAWVADLLRGITRDVRVEADECADGSRVRNVIAIIRGSGRSSNSEAFVIAAEVMLTNFNSTSLRAHPLAAALRAGDTLARAKWLAKDAYIVISVSASGCRCSPAPFGGCAYADSSAIVPWAVSVGGMSRSPNRPATVRGAIVLDWSPSSVLSERARMALFLPAPYGRLPDLDIMTLIMQRSRIPVTFSPDSDCSSSLPPDSYAGKLFGLLSFMASVAVGPYKSHSVFLSNKYDTLLILTRLCFVLTAWLRCLFLCFSVDALTLSVVPPCPSDTRRGVVDGITEAVKAVELFGNAISTVEERLHASFYFYFLLSPNSYVSLGKPIALKMLAIRCSLDFSCAFYRRVLLHSRPHVHRASCVLYADLGAFTHGVFLGGLDRICAKMGLCRNPLCWCKLWMCHHVASGRIGYHRTCTKQLLGSAVRPCVFMGCQC